MIAATVTRKKGDDDHFLQVVVRAAKDALYAAINKDARTGHSITEP